MFKGPRTQSSYTSASNDYVLLIKKKQEIFTGFKTYYTRVMEGVYYEPLGYHEPTGIVHYLKPYITDPLTPVVQDLLPFIRGIKPGTDTDVLCILQQCVDTLHNIPHIGPIFPVTPNVLFQGFNLHPLFTYDTYLHTPYVITTFFRDCTLEHLPSIKHMSELATISPSTAAICTACSLVVVVGGHQAIVIACLMKETSVVSRFYDAGYEAVLSRCAPVMTRVYIHSQKNFDKFGAWKAPIKFISGALTTYALSSNPRIQRGFVFANKIVGSTLVRYVAERYFGGWAVRGLDIFASIQPCPNPSVQTHPVDPDHIDSMAESNTR